MERNAVKNFAQYLIAGTFAGGGIMVFLAAEKLIYRNDIIAEHGPLMLAGGLMLLAGMLMFCRSVTCRIFDSFLSDGK